jgi:hypothetical protein
MSEEINNETKTIEQKNILQKAKSLAKSVASRGLNNKKVSPKTKELRMLSCHGDGGDLRPCSQRKPSAKHDGSFFCNACGCGDKTATQLTDITVDGKENYGKLDYPKVWCPLTMPGFQPYRPSIEDAEEVRNPRKVIIENMTSVEYIKEMSSGENYETTEEVNNEHSNNNQTV